MLQSLGSGATFTEVSKSQLETFKIPLPPLPEQRRIAAILNEQMAAVEKARASAEVQRKAAEALPGSYLRKVFKYKTGDKLPEGWRWMKLGEMCELNPRRPLNLTRNDDTLTSFVPMSAIDETLGIIMNPEKKPFKVIRKGYTFFAENDVLFAKITPCMQNGKHAIARNLIDGIGFGSTEFHVLRPADQIIPEWVHFYIRQPIVLRDATKHFTGAVGQQRVPEYFLTNLSIPLPPLPEQRRIAAILNEQMTEAEKLRESVEDQLDAIKFLPASLLRQAFCGNL